MHHKNRLFKTQKKTKQAISATYIYDTAHSNNKTMLNYKQLVKQNRVQIHDFKFIVEIYLMILKRFNVGTATTSS